MAGSYAHVEFDDDEAQAMLTRLLEFGAQHGRDLLTDMGEHLLDATRDRAEREVGPDGIPWVPLRGSYARRKAKKRGGLPMLRLDYHLLGDMMSYQLDGDTALDLGTNAIYGAAHQFGHEPAGIPARPFLGVSEQDADDLLGILGEHLQAAIDGG